MSLLFDYPWYFIIGCLLLGAVYASLLYFFGKGRRGQRDFSASLTVVLWLLRMVAVSVIAFLLLAPMVKRVANRKEKPVVIVAEDNSQSLRYCKDSSFYATQFKDMMDDMAEELSKDFDVQRYTYGQAVRQTDDDRMPFADCYTDMSQLIKEIDNLYYHRNVGAVVMTGDGIYNHGVNPVSVAKEVSYPIYTVAMGDTTRYRDAAVANVRCNRIAYLGNTFPMEVTVNATRMKGEKATLTVSCDGKKTASKEVLFNEEQASVSETFVLDAERAGMRHYSVTLSPASNEKTLVNNHSSVVVEVVDGHQKVAIIAAVPHPDIAALRRALESNRNFEVESFVGREFNKQPQDYDLLILHQLPAKSAVPAPDVNAIASKGVPVLFVLGEQSDLPRMNALHGGVEVFSRIDRMNEATALANSGFTYFSLSEESLKRIATFPPLATPFGDYKIGGNGQTLLYSRVGNVNSGQPLVAAGQQNGRRYAVIAGTGLWHWRLSDWQQYGTYDDFDNMIYKLVSFAALRIDKERLHVETSHLFGQNEPVVFEAQLYDENYEPVNVPDVELTVERVGRDSVAGPRNATYHFNRKGSGYSLNIGVLGAGSYNYSAKTLFNGHTYTTTGGFVVEQTNIEASNTVADHSILKTVAATTGGEMVMARDVETLVETIKSRSDLRTIIYTETSYGEMLNMPLMFIVIILLLGMEWVLRKYNGTL